MEIHIYMKQSYSLSKTWGKLDNICACVDALIFIEIYLTGYVHWITLLQCAWAVTEKKYGDNEEPCSPRLCAHTVLGRMITIMLMAVDLVDLRYSVVKIDHDIPMYTFVISTYTAIEKYYLHHKYIDEHWWVYNHFIKM